jgi:hypothetical protein
MRYALMVICAGLGWMSTAAPASGQNTGTCDSPLHVGDEGYHEITLDTRLGSNNENNDCVDSLATGPDIVLDFEGMPAGGTVTWTADFDAVVYYRRGTCDSRCRSSSRTGQLGFDANWRWEGDHATWDPPYIIVDGVNGAAGSITLIFDFTTANPTTSQSWGRIKNRYD